MKRKERIKESVEKKTKQDICVQSLYTQGPHCKFPKNKEQKRKKIIPKTTSVMIKHWAHLPRRCRRVHRWWPQAEVEPRDRTGTATWRACTRACATAAGGGRASSGWRAPRRRRPPPGGAGDRPARRTPTADAAARRGTPWWAAPPRTRTGSRRPPARARARRAPTRPGGARPGTRAPRRGGTPTCPSGRGTPRRRGRLRGGTRQAGGGGRACGLLTRGGAPPGWRRRLGGSAPGGWRSGRAPARAAQKW